MKKASQKGIAHLGILLLLIIVAVIAFAGYKVYQNHNASVVPTPTASTSTVGQTATAITSKADLTTVENQLNSQNIDGDLNPAGFSSDVSSLQ